MEVIIVPSHYLSTFEVIHFTLFLQNPINFSKSFAFLCSNQ